MALRASRLNAVTDFALIFCRNRFCRTRAFRPTTALLAMLVLSIHLSIASSISAQAQDALPTENPPQAGDSSAAIDKAIRKVHEDFQDHLEKKKKLVENYDTLQTSIKQTETEWNRIQNEGVIKQFAAIQSAMNSMQLSNTIGSIGSAPGGNNSQNDAAMRQQLQQQLMVNRMMENMNTYMRSQELQQLGVEAQRTIRARFETIQKIMKVEEEYRQWQLGSNQFFEKYWAYTNPQKSYSASETQTALTALQDREKDNTPAELAEAILLTNKGDYSQAKQMLDPLSEAPGPLQPIALMCKALALQGMEKDRESKLAMQNSIKIERTNPYCRWLRARLACKQDQSNIAETEWKALTTIASMELDAKRALAIIYAQRVAKVPSSAGKAVSLANEALDEQSPPDWYSHYVLAVALHSAKKKEDALESLEAAKKLAASDQQELCDKLKEAIENDQPFTPQM